MSRRKDIRRPRPELTLHVEPLEARWLLNADGRRPRPDQSAAPLARALESLRESRSDAASFALELAQHPRLADDLGLGALSRALRRHEGYAARHGWGTALTRLLAAHPRYAAAHHLTGLRVSSAASTTAQQTLTTQQTLVTPVATPSDAPAPVGPASGPAPIVLQDPQTVAVRGYLDVMLPNLGLVGAGLTYTITPQPLPANMTFNRSTSELIFAPAPGQEGTYHFSVAISGGSQLGTVVLPVTVTDPPVPSTEVSGQVVDENGNPLAGMPVSIGSATAVTDREGDFTLTGVPADPGPLSAGGSVARAEDRLPLMAPVPQLLGHSIYMGVRNVIPKPLIVPTVDWSSPASFDQSSAAQPLDITNAAMPGFDIQIPANTTPGAVPAAGTVEVAELRASLAAQHMRQGVSTGMLLYKVKGEICPSRCS